MSDRAVTLLVSLAPGSTAFRLDGAGDGGRMVLDFDRSQLAKAIEVYALLAPSAGEERVVQVVFEP